MPVGRPHFEGPADRPILYRAPHAPFLYRTVARAPRGPVLYRPGLIRNTTARPFHPPVSGAPAVRHRPLGWGFVPAARRYPVLVNRPRGAYVARPEQAAAAGKQTVRRLVRARAENRLVRAQAAAQAVRVRLRAKAKKRLSRKARVLAAWEGKAKKAVEFALAQRGKPYVWGGTGKRGYDCSGLVQSAWEKAGVKIPRVTYAQYRGIDKRVPKSDLRPGDLLFFRGLGHVGMYVGDDKYVHAPRPGRTVTVERLSDRTNYVGAVRPAWPGDL